MNVLNTIFKQKIFPVRENPFPIRTKKNPKTFVTREGGQVQIKP